jgi:hypothetical protein
MTQITTVTIALLGLLVLALLGAPLLQDNLRAVEIKRDHAERLAQWGAERAGDVSKDEAPIQMAAAPCAFLPWLADFPQLAPWPDTCATNESADLDRKSTL